MVLYYVLLGIMVAMPIGAISIEMIKQALRNGFRHSWLIGLGSMVVDTVLIIALNLGMAEVLNKFQTYLWLLGAMFLIYLGWESIKNSSIAVENGNFQKEPLSKMFKRGVLMGVNPGNIVFWLSVLGTSIAGASENKEISLVVVSIAILVGIAIHDVGLAFIASYFNRFMTPRSYRYVSVVAGIALLGFAAYFASQGIGNTTIQETVNALMN